MHKRDLSGVFCRLPKENRALAVELTSCYHILLSGQRDSNSLPPAQPADKELMKSLVEQLSLFQALEETSMRPKSYGSRSLIHSSRAYMDLDVFDSGDLIHQRFDFIGDLRFLRQWERGQGAGSSLLLTLDMSQEQT